MKYSITAKNQLYVLRDAMIFSGFCIVAVLLIGLTNDFETDLFVFFGLFYFINIFVVLLLHTQYYIRNKNTTITFNKTSKILIYHKNNSSIKINFDEINNVEIHLFPSLYRESDYQITPFELYHYAIIITDSERIIITSLMIKNIPYVFRDLGLKVKKIKRIFPTIKE